MKDLYLVLKPMTLKIEGLLIENFHENGEIYLSYNKKKDAKKASEGGKYQILVLTQKMTNMNKKN